MLESIGSTVYLTCRPGSAARCVELRAALKCRKWLHAAPHQAKNSKLIEAKIGRINYVSDKTNRVKVQICRLPYLVFVFWRTANPRWRQQHTTFCIPDTKVSSACPSNWGIILTKFSRNLTNREFGPLGGNRISCVNISFKFHRGCDRLQRM